MFGLGKLVAFSGGIAGAALLVFALLYAMAWLARPPPHAEIHVHHEQGPVVSVAADTEAAVDVAGGIYRHALWFIPVAGAGLLMVKRPRAGRRLVSLLAALFLFSVAAFLFFRGFLPDEPARDSGALADYLRWTGLAWFMGMDPGGGGLLQGRLAADGAAVAGQAFLLTTLVVMLGFLLLLALAVPLGVAVGLLPDFPGASVPRGAALLLLSLPAFLLALGVVYAAGVWWRVDLAAAYQQGDSGVRLWRMVWPAALVLALAGMAGAARFLGASIRMAMEDPSVLASRARGEIAWRWFLAFPLRISLACWFRMAERAFPQLVSGAVAVALVFHLPASGALLLDTLAAGKMETAAGLSVSLFFLGVAGVIVCEAISVVLDPRPSQWEASRND